MRVEIDWEVFHLRFFNDNTVFVKEHPLFFEFVTYEGIILIHSIKEKSENNEENIIFIERYMTDKKNLVKVLEFEGYENEELEELEKPEEEFAVKLEEKDK